MTTSVSHLELRRESSQSVSVCLFMAEPKNQRHMNGLPVPKPLAAPQGCSVPLDLAHRLVVDGQWQEADVVTVSCTEVS